GQLGGRHPRGRRGLGDLLAVLVGSGQEAHVETVEPLESGDRVGGDVFVGVTNVRRTDWIRDRSGDVIGPHRDSPYCVRVSSSRPGKREAPTAPEPSAPLIAAHTHLDACGAHDADGVVAIVELAAAVGVGAVVPIADDLESARWVTRAADWDPRVYAAAALHPTRA